MVGSANDSYVDTAIYDGRILMEGKHMEGEDEIKDKAKEVAYELVKGGGNKNGRIS